MKKAGERVKEEAGGSRMTRKGIGVILTPITCKKSLLSVIKNPIPRRKTEKLIPNPIFQTSLSSCPKCSLAQAVRAQKTCYIYN